MGTLLWIVAQTVGSQSLELKHFIRLWSIEVLYMASENTISKLTTILQVKFHCSILTCRSRYLYSWRCPISLNRRTSGLSYMLIILAVHNYSTTFLTPSFKGVLKTQTTIADHPVTSLKCHVYLFHGRYCAPLK